MMNNVKNNVIPSVIKDIYNNVVLNEKNKQ